MRICELGDGDGRPADGEEQQQQQQEQEGPVSGEVVRVRAKRALVGAGARVLFYPTLLYNVLRNQFEAEFRWWDRVDQCILLGAVPFPSDVPRLKQLGVQGVVTLNEPYETLVPMSLYQAHGIDHLVIATRDYCFAPSLADICRAIEFIHHNASQGGTTYVHCKAGRGRSTTIVLCYLIKYRNMTPEAALDHVRSIRPRVLLAPSQWQAVIVFSTLSTGRLPVQSSNLSCYVEDSKASIPDIEIDDYSIEFDYEDGGLPLCQVMLPMPSSPTGCIDAVFITEEDLEGYDMHIDTAKDVVSWEVVASRKPIMRRLSCLFGSLKLTSNCEPAPSRFTEIHDAVVDGQSAKSGTIETSNKEVSIAMANEIDDPIEFDYEDGGLPLCQVMLPMPSSPAGCIDAVFITEEDLEGYDMHIDTAKDVVSWEVVASRKPIMRRLSCLFGSLKLTSNCEPAPSRFTEVSPCCEPRYVIL